jgi:uncharacterized membrane protein (UPF0182 family)
LSAAWGLIAHVVLVHVERLAHHFRTVIGAMVANLLLSALLGLIAYILLIHVKRLTHHFLAAVVALLANRRLILLLGVIATLSAFCVPHLGSRTAVCSHS